MAPDISHEIDTTSYTYLDRNDCVIVNCYANGIFEQKDIDVFAEVDSLQVTTPADEKWSFQLYNHIFPEQMEVTVTIKQNQTIIELHLFKQQTNISWPQLYCRQSIPITPERKNYGNNLIDQHIHSSIDEQKTFELPIKKARYHFSENLDNEATVEIDIKNVHNLQVQFTETNFTIIFYSRDPEFHRFYAVTSQMLIKIFARVKERIIPSQCSYRVNDNNIIITIIKETENGLSWNQLEPDEYAKTVVHRPISELRSSTIHDIENKNISNQAIPLPAPRLMDRLPNRNPSSSSSYQRNTGYTSNTVELGYTGIYNPANSCFMNAALQCLSNTRELRDYFLKLYHLVEINQTNPLGMKGAMATEFGNVIKALWSGQSSFTYANNLREYAAKRHQEFVGNGQHDAQELLTIVLDAIHEDLNRIINKPQVPPVEDANRPDHIVADEYWNGYLSRNDSVIVQLFTGQFKSKTKCPQCHKESVTFDPFTSLSVPIPKRAAVDTIVTYRTDEKPSIKFRITMSADGSIGDLKRLLSHKTNLSITKMLAYRFLNHRSVEYLKDADPVQSNSYSWHNSDIIYITETLTSEECNNEPIVQLTFYQRRFKTPDFPTVCAYCQASANPQSTPEFCKNCYQVSYCDESCQKWHAYDHKYNCGFSKSDNYENVGLPFIISLSESQLNCQNLFEQIKIHAKRSLDIRIEHLKTPRSPITVNDYGEFINIDNGDNDDDDDDDDDDFSDIENTDWTIIKSTLASSDAWSICRIGDYFVKRNQIKRLNQQKQKKEKLFDSSNNDDDEANSMKMSDDDRNSDDSTEEYDMLDDIYGDQPLFRIMPRPADNLYNNNDTNHYQPILGYGDTSDRILRKYTTFFIDWFTDNKDGAPLRVASSKNYNGINGIIEDESVSKSLHGDQEVTLQQCLQLFIEPEVLGPDDKWYCPNCKEHIQAEKRMSVWRLPPILIIHLKRFKYNQYSSFGYMSSTREKIETTVKFPIHDLNMEPYCSSTSEVNQEQIHSLRSRYDLFGIINHRGTAWFGHYTAYARLLANNDSAKTEIGWRNFDDERVSNLTDIKDLVRSDAYVLFYRHRYLPVNISVHEQLQRIITESTQLETTTNIID